MEPVATEAPRLFVVGMDGVARLQPPNNQIVTISKVIYPPADEIQFRGSHSAEFGGRR